MEELHVVAILLSVSYSALFLWNSYDISKLRKRLDFLEFKFLRSESDESKNGQ